MCHDLVRHERVFDFNRNWSPQSTDSNRESFTYECHHPRHSQDTYLQHSHVSWSHQQVMWLPRSCEGTDMAQRSIFGGELVVATVVVVVVVRVLCAEYIITL